MLPETNKDAAAFEQDPAFADPLLFGTPPPTAGAEFGLEDAWN